MQFSCPICNTILNGLTCPKCGKTYPDPVKPYLDAWVRQIESEESQETIREIKKT